MRLISEMSGYAERDSINCFPAPGQVSHLDRDGLRVLNVFVFFRPVSLLRLHEYRLHLDEQQEDHYEASSRHPSGKNVDWIGIR